MCQSIQTVYKFCGCSGELYQQKCPLPTATCQILLRTATKLQLTCYCEEHSARPFKTVRQDQRDLARVNKENDKIVAREQQQQQQQQRHNKAKHSLGPDEASAPASPAAGEPLSPQDRSELISQRQKGAAELRRREREMQEHGRKWGERATTTRRTKKKKKHIIAKARSEGYKWTKAHGKSAMKRDRSCVVM